MASLPGLRFVGGSGPPPVEHGTERHCAFTKHSRLVVTRTGSARNDRCRLGVGSEPWTRPGGQGMVGRTRHVGFVTPRRTAERSCHDVHERDERAARDPGGRLEVGGTWAWAYADVSGNVEDPRRQAALKLRAVEESLRAPGRECRGRRHDRRRVRAGAGVPSPVTGTCSCTTASSCCEVLPGTCTTAEAIGVGAVPDLVPLVAHRPVDLPFLVVHVGREGGTFRAYRLGHAPDTLAGSEQQVQGRTDTLHYAKAGTGWKQPHWQAHTEEIWKQTSAEVAGAVDEAVRRLRPGSSSSPGTSPPVSCSSRRSPPRPARSSPPCPSTRARTTRRSRRSSSTSRSPSPV